MAFRRTPACHPSVPKLKLGWYNVAEEQLRRGDKQMAGKTRKIRSDATIATAAKKAGIPEAAFRNPDGRKKRKDTKIGTIRRQKK